MSHLSISGLSKTFGDFTALQAIDLEADKGAFLALLGPSGCGKSTLLRIIAGLETPDTGSIAIAGRDVSHLPPERRDVALMFQSYALLPHMTVLENVRFPLRMQNRHRRARQYERAEAALRLVQLVDLDGRYPRQLSGGQQQRVALARSIVAEPQILLLDEPLSNLDARLREDMQVELKRLHQQLGLTTVFVTHDQTEALALADTVVLMKDGRIEQLASPREIYDRPRTHFAADFLGGANVLTLPVSRDGNGWRATLPDGTAVPLLDDGTLAEGQRSFMLRKEAIGVDPAGEDIARLEAVVETVNFLGGSTRLVVRAGGARLIAIDDGAITAEPGATVTIGWRHHDLVPLADAST